MDSTVARFFRDQFRQGRAIALQDAEGFQEIIFVLERLGAYLSGRIKDMGQYRDAIVGVALNSPLADDIPTRHNTWHSKVSAIYELVRDARNDALHQGAFARHLTSNVINLALVVEDALMSNANTVGEFMVRDPICASLWQPISFIRQQMLKYSFTYLPLSPGTEDQQRWLLVSDFRIANYLRRGDRKARLAMTLVSGVISGVKSLPLTLTRLRTVFPIACLTPQSTVCFSSQPPAPSTHDRVTV